VRPRFNTALTPNGYEWFYLDALSDDRRYALVVIAMIGNVFSPWYAAARRRGATDPLMHCTMNISLREIGGAHHWSLSERGKHQVVRGEYSLRIGANEMEWRGDSLYLHIDDKQAPFRTPLRGQLKLTPEATCDHQIDLDTSGKHVWRPHASKARVRAVFDAPSLSFGGDGYFDSNRGTEPLESAFRGWSWSRLVLRDGSVVVAYDCEQKNGTTIHDLRRIVGAHAMALPTSALVEARLPRAGWGLGRTVRSDKNARARVVAELLSSPFYARSIVETQIFGQPAVGVHEVVSLDRFAERWVQFLLPFRMIDARDERSES